MIAYVGCDNVSRETFKKWAVAECDSVSIFLSNANTPPYIIRMFHVKHPSTEIIKCFT